MTRRSLRTALVNDAGELVRDIPDNLPSAVARIRIRPAMRRMTTGEAVSRFIELCRETRA